MRYCRQFFFIISLCFISSTSFAALANDIDTLIASNPNMSVGMLVMDANTHEILYKRNENHYFLPASNQKLMTAFAAFQVLPTTFRYQTFLFADLSKVNNHVLEDNVYLKVTGDPTLTYQQLEALIGSLAKANITRINGGFIIDDSAFNQHAMSVGTSWEDSKYCYGSPTMASMLNHNCILSRILPAKMVGQRAELQFPDYPQFVNFQNEVMTYPDAEIPCNMHVNIDPTTIKITGCIKLSDTPKDIDMAVQSPRDNMAKTISYILQKNNITLGNPIQFQNIDHPVKLFANIDSPPLTDLITLMLKNSDNTIANALFKTLGSLYTKGPGSFKNGSLALHAILKETAQIELPERTLFDGAGTSRYNLLTPNQIAAVLQKMYAAPYATQFVAALPISGYDGTLKNRMQTPDLMGKVRAKTGTETAVSSLSGFIVTENQRTLLFVILINGFAEPANQIKLFEDELCKAMMKA